jgi:hypothetical protein
LDWTNRYLAEHEEARKKMEQYMRPMISFLVVQHPADLSENERIYVTGCLHLAVRIIANDIVIQLKTNDEGKCVVLDVLLSIFSENQILYKGSEAYQHGTDSDLHGFPKVRLQLIELFRKQEGFSRIGKYLWRCVKVNSPDVQIVREILCHSTPAGQVRLPTSTVVATWKNILFSEDHCDMKFLCDDGRAFPAHKAILAASSSYFATAFQGPWAENSPCREWKTSHASSIVQAFLAFMYTGDVDDAFFNEKPIDMFSIASEYGTTVLKDIAVAYCILTVSACNFKEMLQLAHLHVIPALKTRCYEYAKKIRLLF